MEKIERFSFLKILFTVLTIAELFSLLTLWLIDSEIKYPLFVIETISIIIIFIILNNYNFKFTRKVNIIKYIPKGIFLDIGLIYSASILIILNIFQVKETFIQLPLAFISTSILSGYTILNICKMRKYFSKLEITILSFLISFAFTGFSSLAFLWMDEFSRSLIIPSLFIVLGIFSMVRHVRDRNIPIFKTYSLSKNIHVIAIGFSLIFYLILIYYFYPSFTEINTDISRHDRWSTVLSRTPDLYSGFNYILFHAFDSSLNVLSGFPDKAYFQSIQIILNLFLPLTIYAFAKRFFADIDKRIPAISVIFYTILSSFLFIDFIRLKLLDNQITDYQILSESMNHTFNDPINFLQPFPWFGPQSVAVMMFIMIFPLLRTQNIPKLKFVFFTSILLLAMYLTHGVESILIIILITFYAFLSKTKSLRLDDFLLSSIISVGSAITISLFVSFLWPSALKNPGINIQTFLPLIGILSIVCVSIFWRKKILHHINFYIKFINYKKFYPVLCGIIISCYLFGFLTWAISNDINSASFMETGVVPWFAYPLMLGIVGLLALLTIRYLGVILPNSSVSILLISISLMFILGKVLSFVNLNFMITQLGEKRMIIYVLIFSAVLAPIPLVKLMSHLRPSRKFFTNVAYSVLISLIVISGFSSLALKSEFWFNHSRANLLNDADTQSIKFLKEIFQKEPNVFTISPSSSYAVLDFAAPPYQFYPAEMPMFSKNPDIPLLSLSAHHLPHAYIVMRHSDLNKLNIQDSWLTQHLLPLLPVVFSNKGVTIYNASHVTYPNSNSETTLIIPTDPKISSQNSWLYAYDIISQGDMNYTVMYDNDRNALKSKNVILSFDPPTNNTLEVNYKFPNSNDWRIISGNWNYLNDGLHGGDTSNNPSRIILSPSISENFTINTSFMINKITPDTSSYISVIYSWKDPDNYKAAVINILNENVYVSFVTVNEGNEYRNPKWPGNITNLKLNHDTLFNMTLSTRTNSTDLILNNKELLHEEQSNTYGYIGLGYGRIRDVVFDHFQITQFDQLNIRPPSDYISYVQSGGNLIILNTNGYGTFADSLFNLNSTLLETNKIITNSGKELLLDSASNQISVSSKNIIPIAFYNSPIGKSSVFFAEESIGIGQIKYLNIYPIIINLKENKTRMQESYKIFGDILDLVELKLKSNESYQPNIRDMKVNFKDITGIGNIMINTTSLVFPEGPRLREITIKENHMDVTIANVTKLKLDGYSHVILYGDYISLKDGKGLYGNIRGNLTNMFFKDNAIVEVITDNNLYHFDNVTDISIRNNELLQVYARQPSLNMQGNITISYPKGSELIKKIGSTATEINVLGNVTLTLFMSDSYSYGNDIVINGSIERTPIRTYFDEIGYLSKPFLQFDLKSFPLFLIPFLIIPFFIAVIFMLPATRNHINRTSAN